MSERKELGRIQTIKVGHVGYQDAYLGVGFTLGGKGWGVCDSWGFWSPHIVKHSENAKWTETERQSSIYEAFARLSKMMSDAGIDDSNKLVGLPIEITFTGNTLKEWRLLTEVLP